MCADSTSFSPSSDSRALSTEKVSCAIGQPPASSHSDVRGKHVEHMVPALGGCWFTTLANIRVCSSALRNSVRGGGPSGGDCVRRLQPRCLQETSELGRGFELRDRVQV